MIDYLLLLEEHNASAAAKIQENAALSDSDRVSHILTYHLTELTELTEREKDFNHSAAEWLTKRIGSSIPDYAMIKVSEMEDKYCNHVCKAMKKAGVLHR